MLRPLVFFDHEDPQTWYRQDEFLFGDHLLVCPVLEPNRQSRRMYVPRGKWYHFYSDQLVEGGKEHLVDTPLNEIPTFVQAGAIIPRSPVQQYVGENPDQAVELHVYRGEETKISKLYEDQGDGYAYKQGMHATKSFTVIPSEEKYRITQFREGRMPSQYAEYKMVFHGFKSTPKSVEVNSQDYPVELTKDKESFAFKVPEDFNQITLRWV